MTLYRFRRGLGVYFLADGAVARAMLPSALHPLQPRPGHAVLALTALDFADSEVGAYGELVLSILVPPYAERGDELPVSGVFPFAVATTTDASAAHTAERWRLPVQPWRVGMHFGREGDRHRLEVTAGDRPVLRLSTDQGPCGASSTLYQCFTWDDQLYRFGVQFEGPLFEHEDETGELVLCGHPLTAGAEALLVDEVPLREQSMSAGLQRLSSRIPHGVVS
jgi:hypothetical protein